MLHHWERAVSGELYPIFRLGKSGDKVVLDGLNMEGSGQRELARYKQPAFFIIKKVNEKDKYYVLADKNGKKVRCYFFDSWCLFNAEKFVSSREKELINLTNEVSLMRKFVDSL